jgi:tetratricopeptide (TPR) repeat protein
MMMSMLATSCRRKTIAGAIACLLAVLPAHGWASEKGAAPPESAQRVRQLVQQLGDNDYSVRQRAQDELAKLGFAAFDLLSEAADNEDLEVATRARYLLRLMRVQWTRDDDPSAVKALLDGYDSLSLDERIARMQKLAAMPATAGVAALCRLVRYELSPMLSKSAAVAILNREPIPPADEPKLGGIVRENLAGSSQTAAKWLLTYLALRKDPKATMAAWNRLVEVEQGVLRRTPDRSSPRIVGCLLYDLAVAQAGQGLQDLADKTAQRARQVIPGRTAADLYGHLLMAYSLRRRGLFPWAVEEYRQVMRSSFPECAAMGYIALSEMYHDIGDDPDAAQTIQDALKMVDQRALENLEAVTDHSVAELRARMNYFLACHWQAKGDAAKHRQYVEEALKVYPTEVDSLIARYRLPDQDPDYRKKTRELIGRAVAGMREEIEKTPEDATGYNQLAWLLGNTEGDLDEALRLVQKSVELSPDNGAYYDTMGRVCYARGDYPNAVKYQSLAAELEPHSGLILKQLQLFKDQLREHPPKNG